MYAIIQKGTMLISSRSKEQLEKYKEEQKIEGKIIPL